MTAIPGKTQIAAVNPNPNFQPTNTKTRSKTLTVSEYFSPFENLNFDVVGLCSDSDFRRLGIDV
jgi:hypothetical protein